GLCCIFFFSSRRRHTRFSRDWSSDVCSSDLIGLVNDRIGLPEVHCRQVMQPAGDKQFLDASAAMVAAYKVIIEVTVTIPANEIRSEERRVGKEWRTQRKR